MNPLEPEIPKPGQVRVLRENAGLTQKQFAKRLHTTEDRVKKYEMGLHDMNAPLWLLARISCDPLLRARWLKAIARSGEKQ